MTIDYISFSPWNALVGGALIGLASGALILFSGRIAGIAGIVGGLFNRGTRMEGWRWLFVLGLIAAPIAYQAFGALPETHFVSSTPLLVLAGLLVGYGTRLGSGCTSGHGVCGLSRLSVRSLAAVLTFMGSGFVTVYVLKHLL